MPEATVSIRVKSDVFVEIGRAMRAHEDGKQLRKDLQADLKAAVAPGVSAVQAKLRAIPSSQGITSSPALGAYLATRVKPQVRLAGRSAGVRVRIGQTPNLRGFTNAARRLNRAHWKHRVFGSDEFVQQDSPIQGYFDDTLAAGKAGYRAAVLAALEKTARRITGH